MKQLDNYLIKINGLFLKGFKEEETEGKTSHSGWSPNAVELEKIELTSEKSDAYVVQGNFNLKSYFEKIYSRMRFSGLKIDQLEFISHRSEQ